MGRRALDQLASAIQGAALSKGRRFDKQRLVRHGTNPSDGGEVAAPRGNLGGHGPPLQNIGLVNGNVAAGEIAAGRVTRAQMDGEEIIGARRPVVGHIHCEAESLFTHGSGPRDVGLVSVKAQGRDLVRGKGDPCRWIRVSNITRWDHLVLHLL